MQDVQSLLSSSDLLLECNHSCISRLVGSVMLASNPGAGYAFNRTRQAFLATELSVADTHWKRLRGLIGTQTKDFGFGRGLWIVPSHGIHTLGMRYSVDLVYLSEDKTVFHVEENVKPWRIAPLHLDALTVLELPSHTVWNTETTIGDCIEIGFPQQQVASAGYFGRERRRKAS